MWWSSAINPLIYTCGTEAHKDKPSSITLTNSHLIKCWSQEPKAPFSWSFLQPEGISTHAKPAPPSGTIHASPLTTGGWKVNKLPTEDPRSHGSWLWNQSKTNQELGNGPRSPLLLRGHTCCVIARWKTVFCSPRLAGPEEHRSTASHGIGTSSKCHRTATTLTWKILEKSLRLKT